MSNTSSKNNTLKRNKSTTPTSNLPAISPVSSNADSQLDFLLKSLAKESLTGVARDESRNKLEGYHQFYGPFCQTMIVSFTRNRKWLQVFTGGDTKQHENHKRGQTSSSEPHKVQHFKR